MAGACRLTLRMLRFQRGRGAVPGRSSASPHGRHGTSRRTGYRVPAMGYTVRQARTSDVPGILGLIEANVASGRLLGKATVTLYEDIQEFWVAERESDGLLAGCGALHVLWEDLAEIRTIAVSADCQGRGIGNRIVRALLGRARELGVERVFVLTFAVNFFASLGFEEISGTPVAPDVYAELLRSYDEGVAEFLELDWVKPNTLGNTRMLLRL
jgi:amino-acid N-acetyltransferase